MKIGLTVTGGILLVIGIVVGIVTNVFGYLAQCFASGGVAYGLQVAFFGSAFIQPTQFYAGLGGIAVAILGLILLIVGLVSHKPQN